MFKVGDKIRVTNDGATYPGMYSVAIELNLTNWEMGSLPNIGATCTIVGMTTPDDCGFRVCAIRTEPYYGKQSDYVMNERGIELIESPSKHFEEELFQV